ncbi:MAG TPA: DUF1993 domain-containing protein [Rhizomicrobium sp.]|nr:DUF1993 domain-containing protein [Rhizomicrobium sp.]
MSKLTAHAVLNETMIPMLQSLAAILDKAAQFAETKKIDPVVLASARLAPDMFPLTRQVQMACDTLKNAAALLAGEQPERFEDNEKTLDDLKARIAKCIAYVQSFKASAYDGAEARQLTVPLINKLVFEADGATYVKDWAIPHFFFHVVTAYDILRHNGLEIGKRDYLSHAGQYIVERG